MEKVIATRHGPALPSVARRRAPQRARAATAAPTGVPAAARRAWSDGTRTASHAATAAEAIASSPHSPCQPITPISAGPPASTSEVPVAM